MATAVASGTASASYSDGNSLSKTADGAFCTKFTIGKRDYGFEFVSTGGVDGQGSKKFGFRMQKITFTVHYIGSSETAVVGTAATDGNSMAAGAGFQLVLAGQTFYGCFLDDFEIQQPKSTGFGKFEMEIPVSIISIRLA